jgi:hypothetical protein
MYQNVINKGEIPVAARSKRGSAAAGSLALLVPIPLGAWLASLHFHTRLPAHCCRHLHTTSAHVMITLTFTEEHQNTVIPRLTSDTDNEFFG